MDINVTIKCPDLPLSATTLADAIAKLTVLAMLTPEADIKPEAVKAAMQAAMQAPVAVNPTPATPPAAAVNVSGPAQTPAPAPTAAPVATVYPSSPTVPAAVPTSPAPQITGDMVAKAGADLIAANPAAMAQLNGLLQKYGVGCAQELRPDQIGPFATEMRALGAKV